MIFFGALFLALLNVRVGAQDGVVIVNDPDAVCTVCENGDDPIPEPTFAYFSSSGQNCSAVVAQLDALTGATQESDECKDLQLLAFQIGCCLYPPYEYCDICADGTPFDREAIVPLGTANDPSCEAIQYRSSTLIGVFEVGTCDDTYLRRSSFYCGCQNVQQECFLCPETQEAPGNPKKGDAFVTQSNCRGMEYLFSVFDSAECADATVNFGVDLAGFCECPGHVLNETAADCHVCPDGGKLTNPDHIWTTEADTYERTCKQAEAFAEFVIRDSACDALMTAPRDGGCKCSSSAFGLSVIFSTLFGSALVIKNLFL